MNDRAAHWIKHNQQERIPPRMVVFDTEAKSSYDDGIEYQSWRTGTAIRWRTDLKRQDIHEAKVFDTPLAFWEWVSDFCRSGTRTVAWAHNLGYDVRVSQAFTILPTLGFRLEWCNLDRNVSSMTWRSDHGTLVFADTWTWIPLPLKEIGAHLGLDKLRMPNDNATQDEWNDYCLRDTEIAYRVVLDLVQFIKAEGLGNWQPTGAGMAYTTWRHKFMEHKVLCHDDAQALQAERTAMYTGRAEAWKHGILLYEKWTEVDLRNAYLTIAEESELPRKLHMHTGSISMEQYASLNNRFAVLCRCDVDTTVPVLPHRTDDKIIWPIGQFTGWYWDTEVNCALRNMAHIKIREAYVYARAPILRKWAAWIRERLQDNLCGASPIVATWLKHCGRAFIGRLALRTPSWEQWADNIEGITGITYAVFPEEKRTARLLHVGPDVLIETARDEGKDSLPQITGWIMARCRVRLWDTMNVAGLENIAHVDTDSILCRTSALGAIRSHYGVDFQRLWSIKGTYTQLEMFGPRSYYRDKRRVISGIPSKAKEVEPGKFVGEAWASLATDLEEVSGQLVRVREATWRQKRTDPRRLSAEGVSTDTVAIRVYNSSSSALSTSTVAGVGL